MDLWLPEPVTNQELVLMQVTPNLREEEEAT